MATVFRSTFYRYIHFWLSATVCSFRSTSVVSSHRVLQTVCDVSFVCGSRKHITFSVLSLLALTLLSACDAGSSVSDRPVEANTSASTVAMPRALAQSRAVNPDQLYVLLTVNGVTQRLEAGTGSSSGTDILATFSADPFTDLSVTVDWYETLETGEELLLASWEGTQSVSDENIRISVGANQYATSGESRFDVDGDGISNLDERELGTSATIPDEIIVVDPGAADASVVIPRISSDTALMIDGLYDEQYGMAAFNDIDGNQLKIDNRMINQGAGAIRNDGETEFQWFAMHDDEFMYLFVLSESVALANVIRDSEDPWRDDSISVFLDGDNSKGNEYDGVDDRYFVIPLLTSPASQTDNSTVIITGSLAAPLPAFEFNTCFCTNDRHAFEMRIPLDEFGITPGVPFGFDIHIDLDHDGGDRDAKWSWWRPSAGDINVDDSWLNPSVLGTVVLEQ